MIGSSANRGRQRSEPRWTAAAWVFLMLGAVTVMLSLASGETVRTVLFHTVPAVSIGAVLAGTLRHPPRGSRWPWGLVVAALAAMAVGSILRYVVPAAGVGGPPAAYLPLAPNLVVLTGYVALAWSLMVMLCRRCAARDDPARTDAMLVGVGVALIVWAYLIAPSIWSTADPSWTRILTGVFPMVDVLAAVIMIYMIMADGTRPPSLWLMATFIAAMAAGDFAFVVVQLRADPPEQALAWFVACVIAAYVAVGAAALHPSMRALAQPQSVTVRALGVPRAVTLAAAVFAPAFMALVSPPSNIWNWLVRTVLTGLFAIMIVVRIMQTTTSWLRAEQAERWRGTHDALTGLANRELLTQTLTAWGTGAVSQGKEISLLVVDLDRFKTVNNVWGHRVGDELLCAVADRLSSIVRGEDLVCRLGLDRFVIALATASPSASAPALAQRLVEEFATPFALSVGEVTISPSIGVATSGETVPDALKLIHAADTAMYEAKDAGRNRWRSYDAAIDERARRRASLEQALRGALERDELSVHYQPIIDLRDETPTGFEALMRWTHPRLGIVSPGEFIPIAEDTGMIVPSGTRLLEQAAAQLAAGRQRYPDEARGLHVSANLSVRQLRDPALVDVVEGILERTGLPVSALWLEITESCAMEDPTASLAILRSLRDMGATICIDDFGTGHSSLSYLTKLPARIVKIDRSLVADVGTGTGIGGENEAIVYSVISMAHILDRQVVAEGVETTGQRDWLRAHDCDLAQGYLYGAPAPAAAREASFVKRGTDACSADTGATSAG